MNVNIEFKMNDLSFRFCNFVDNRVRDFEDGKVRSKMPRSYTVVDVDGDIQDLTWPVLSYWQSYRYLEHRDRPFYLLQVSNLRTQDHYQIAVEVKVSKISLFQQGTVQKWIFSDASPEAIATQKEMLKQLVDLCRHHTQLMSIRVQPYMPGRELLNQAHQMLAPMGFSGASSRSYVQTRFVDLRPSVEEMLAKFNANGRVKLKVKDKFAGETFVRDVCDDSTASYLQAALNDSFQRSAKKLCPYDFSPLFKSANKFSRDVVILGFYLRESLTEPKAFITGVRHHNVVEFSVGGSRSDQKLRKFPFNHVLMWQLALRSKDNGNDFLDMGGISTEANSLEGITSFKRLFPGFELLVGQEMEMVLRPSSLMMYGLLQKSANQVRDLKNQLAARSPLKPPTEDSFA